MTTMTVTRTAISVSGLRKSFGDNVVLDGIDLTVTEGAIFSLLGPNGAGKTTMVHILSTLITADGGEICVAGYDLANDPDAVRAADGVTIFLTTQYLDEADQLADRIAVLDNGRIVAEGSPESLKHRIPGGHIRLQFANPRELESAAHALGTASRDDEALTLQVPGDGSLRSLRTLLDRLDHRAIEARSLSIHTPNLDD